MYAHGLKRENGDIELSPSYKITTILILRTKLIFGLVKFLQVKKVNEGRQSRGGRHG